MLSPTYLPHPPPSPPQDVDKQLAELAASAQRAEAEAGRKEPKAAELQKRMEERAAKIEVGKMVAGQMRKAMGNGGWADGPAWWAVGGWLSRNSSTGPHPTRHHALVPVSAFPCPALT